MLATVAFNVTVVFLLRYAPWSDWRTGLALNSLDAAFLLYFAIRGRDRFLLNLLIFGFATGFAELAADAWLVDFTKTLDYTIGGGPMLWRSPMWMPLAWAIVAVQFGYIGTLLREKFGAAGIIMIAVLGAVNIPYYEEMARKIGWWEYNNCRMLSFTPWYIILGEGGIAASFALLAARLRTAGARRSVIAGIAGGVAIFVCYAAAWLITDGIL